MSARMPPPVLSTDALVKRATLAALLGLIARQFVSTLTAATLAVVILYLLLILRNAAG